MDPASSPASQGPPAETGNNNNPPESNAPPTPTSSIEPTSTGGGEPASAQPTSSEVASTVSEQTPAPTSSTPAAESSTDVISATSGNTASNNGPTTRSQNPSSSPSSTGSNGGHSTIGPSNQGGNGSHTNKGAIAGGVVGGVVGVALIALALFLIWRRRRRLGQAPKSADDFMSQPYDDDDWRQGTRGAGWNQQQQGRLGPTVQQQIQPLYSASNNDVPINKPNVPIYKPDDHSRTSNSTRRPYPPSPTTPEDQVGLTSANPNSSSSTTAAAAAAGSAATEPDKPDERNDAA